MDIEVLRLSITNDYLIQTANGYVLTDTGYESDWELFCRRLKEVELNISDISHLVLTHHHNDHCGLLNRVVQTNPDVQIVMSCRAPVLLAQGQNDRSRGAGWVNRRVRLMCAVMQCLNKEFGRQWRTHAFPTYTLRASDVLIEGETKLEDVGIALHGRILETPGHTADSISVLLEDGNSFVGDAAANMPQLAGTKHCAPLIEDIDEYYRSWGRLISAGARRVYPGHGKPFAVEELHRDIGSIRTRHMFM